jgi:hypothetical protein
LAPDAPRPRVFQSLKIAQRSWHRVTYHFIVSSDVCSSSSALPEVLCISDQLRCPTCLLVSPEGVPALSMPLPKSLRRPVRRTSTSSSTGRTLRQRCRTCNNLDPRGHASSIYADDVAKDTKAQLSLVIDALTLTKTKTVAQRGCRFCNVLIQSLDAFFDTWRGARLRINVDIREKATIKVSIDSEPWRGETVEIYAGSGR